MQYVVCDERFGTQPNAKHNLSAKSMSEDASLLIKTGFAEVLRNCICFIVLCVSMFYYTQYTKVLVRAKCSVHS